MGRRQLASLGQVLFSSPDLSFTPKVSSLRGAGWVLCVWLLHSSLYSLQTPAAGIVTMGLALGILAPGTGGTGMTLNMTHTGRTTMLTVTGW